MLSALHTARTLKATPVYGMWLPDSVGALGNTLQVADLEDRLRQARRISIHPLKRKQPHGKRPVDRWTKKKARRGPDLLVVRGYPRPSGKGRRLCSQLVLNRSDVDAPI